MGKASDELGTIPITRNLDVALRHLRKTSGYNPILMWIDALCIDQSNNDEKSKQVAIMGSIFSRAKCAIVWLGPEENDSTDVIDMFRFVAQQVEIDWRNRAMKSSKDAASPEWSDKTRALPFVSGELDAVCALFERPYFERLWVRQEVILASHAIVQCGQQRMPWKDFQKAVACLYWKGNSNYARRKVGQSQLVRARDIAYDVCHVSSYGLSLATMALDLRNAKCQDARDRIFSVLRILRDQDQELNIVSDYTKSAEELYVDVTCRYLNANLRLDLLESCELSSKILDVPSWTPDWSSRFDFDWNLHSNWSASAWISPQVTIVDSKRLRVAGVQVGHIKDISTMDMDEHDLGHVQTSYVLDGLRPSDWDEQRHLPNRVDQYCRAIACDNFSDSYFPHRKDRADFESCRDLLDSMWSSPASSIPQRYNGRDVLSLQQLRRYIFGRGLFVTDEGYVGLGPGGAQPGDLIAIVLGCRFPVVLRQALSTDGERAWQVVGVCYAEGLMNGEAIYKRSIPDHCRFVLDRGRNHALVDGRRFALHNTDTDTLSPEPAELLEEAGIDVEYFQRYPHDLSVRPETLLAAGILLRDFTLV